MKRVERMKRQKEQSRKRLTRALLNFSLLSTLTLGAVTVVTAAGQSALEIEKKAAQAHVTPEWKARTLDEVKAEIKRQKELGLDVYVIQWGDTLGTIATATNQNVDELAKINQLENKHLIITGTTLKGVLDKEVATQTSQLVATHNATSANNIQTTVTPTSTASTSSSPKQVDVSESNAKFNTLVAIEQAALPQVAKEKLGTEVAKAETKEDLAKVDEKLQEMTGETKVKVETETSEKPDMSKKTETVKAETSTQPEVTKPSVETPKEETSTVTPEVKPNESNTSITENTEEEIYDYRNGSDSEGRLLGKDGKPLNNSTTHNGYTGITDYVPGQRRPELAGKTLTVGYDFSDDLVFLWMSWDKDGYPLDGYAVRPETQPSGQTDPETTKPSVETPKEETPTVTPEVKPNESTTSITENTEEEIYDPRNGSDSEGRLLGKDGKPLNNSRTHNGYIDVADYVPGQRRPELAGKTLIVDVEWKDGVGLVFISVEWDKDGYPLDGHAVRPETQPSGQTDPETTKPSVETNNTTEASGPTRMSPIGNGGEFATFEDADAYALSKYNDDDWALNSGFTSYRVEPIMWTNGTVTYTIHFS